MTAGGLEVEVVELMGLIVVGSLLHVAWLIYRSYCAASFERVERWSAESMGTGDEPS